MNPESVNVGIGLGSLGSGVSMLLIEALGYTLDAWPFILTGFIITVIAIAAEA